MKNFTQKWIENLFFSKIVRAYLFVPHLCLMLSEVQHGELLDQIQTQMNLSDNHTSPPLLLWLSQLREGAVPTWFLVLWEPFQVLNPVAMFGKGHVLCVMPWVLWDGPSMRIHLFLPLCFDLLSCEKVAMCICLDVQACEQMIHLAHCEGRCEKFEGKDCFYTKFNTNFIENH